MPRSCQFVEACPMFKYFKRFAQKVYLSMYCEGYFADCKRRELRLAGKPVPETLLPNGSTLWNTEMPPE